MVKVLWVGCKLYVLMNQSDEMLCITLSNGHIAYIKMVELLVNGMSAKLYADRGYFNQKLKSGLEVQGADLINYYQKNMQSTESQKQINNI